jgi:uncharacterized protein YbjT (DUF2867 family)
MSTVLVTGASGHLGSLLVPRLVADGHQVRTFSRTAPTAPALAGASACTGDLTDGVGLREALEGVDTVVHCASDPRRPDGEVRCTTNLIEAITDSRQDVHVVYISIVGLDAIPWSYYRAKHDAEKAVESAHVSWTIQRATQFHSFLDTMLGQLARSPVMTVPLGFSFQPVATREVAERLLEHVDRGPAGRAEDFGGPEVLSARDLAHTWLEAREKRRPLVTLPVPGKLGRAFRRGDNLCREGLLGRTTWQQFLAAGDDPNKPAAGILPGTESRLGKLPT